ncbi:chemokine-like factor isoform X2 [Peromyscus californicus insignis]|uniref:chemokine-like factor isoform X2 n=1 Tax=Peromyscus californicus insignis TaxID=564181 RepID=UPI0022A6E1D1|nr:chemokine-like factor isoform X2 [Peromyscus californicus insignis]
MESEEQNVEQPFCLSVKGLVKMLRLAVNVASMTFFIIAQAPEPYIVITGFELTIIFFFITLYLCRLDKVMKWLFWPLLVFGLLTAICAIADCALVYRKLLLNPSGPYRKRSSSYSKDESQ